MKEYIVTEKELGPAHDYFAELFNTRELIRCKDCKHFRQYRVRDRVEKFCWILYGDFEESLEVTEDDFCSRAERKEE